MKYLKSYSKQYYTNESIKDFLKPKSKSSEEIEKTMDDRKLSIEQKYLRCLIYDLDDLIFKIKNKLKYFEIEHGYYYSLKRLNKQQFTELEKQKIDNQIYKEKTLNSYMYNSLDIDSKINDKIGLKIHNINKDYNINKYNNYILVDIVSNYNRHEFYICPTLEQLIQFLDDYLIMAKRIN